jgi:hypothetical protein
MRPAGGDDDVVDRPRQLVEKLLELSSVGDVERGGAQRAQLARRVLQALGSAGDEDDVVPISSAAGAVAPVTLPGSTPGSTSGREDRPPITLTIV